MGISNEVQAGLAATVLQVLGSAQVMQDYACPAAQTAARPAIPARHVVRSCHGLV